MDLVKRVHQQPFIHPSESLCELRKNSVFHLFIIAQASRARNKSKTKYNHFTLSGWGGECLRIQEMNMETGRHSSWILLEYTARQVWHWVTPSGRPLRKQTVLAAVTQPNRIYFARLQCFCALQSRIAKCKSLWNHFFGIVFFAQNFNALSPCGIYSRLCIRGEENPEHEFSIPTTTTFDDTRWRQQQRGIFIQIYHSPFWPTVWWKLSKFCGYLSACTFKWSTRSEYCLAK